MRLKTSRPSWSVPKGWAPPGASKRRAMLVCSGLEGATTGAMTAITRSSPIMMRPARESGLRRVRRTSCCRRGRSSARTRGVAAALLLADLGGEKPAGQVHDQVGQGEDEGNYDGHAHDRGEILRKDRARGVASQPRPGEDRLRQHRALEQAAVVKTNDRDGRQQGGFH